MSAATISRHEGGVLVLPQTAEETRLCVTGDRDRSTQKLRSSEEASHEEVEHRQGVEQPGGRTPTN